MRGSDQFVNCLRKDRYRNRDFHSYFLRVPPHIETAKEAVAWTFGLREREYAPEQES